MPGAGLGHIRWLGGATGAGKTTMAHHLAAAYGLHLYSTDVAISAHGEEPGPDTPLLRRFRRMTMDERWLGQDARTMLDTFPWFRGERFERIITDLQEIPPSRPVVVEGFRLLPRLVHPFLDDPRHGLWLTTTPAFRRRAFEQRAPALRFWARTSDPVAALQRLLERDALFTEQIEDQAAELGLRVLRCDGSRTEADLLVDIADWFHATNR